MNGLCNNKEQMCIQQRKVEKKIYANTMIQYSVKIILFNTGNFIQ